MDKEVSELVFRDGSAPEAESPAITTAATDSQGQSIQVAPEQYDAAVAQGFNLQAGAKIPVVTKDGRVVEIDAASYDAIRDDIAGAADTATVNRYNAFQNQQAAQAQAKAAEEAQYGNQSLLAGGLAAAAGAIDTGTFGLLSGRSVLTAAGADWQNLATMPNELRGLPNTDPRVVQWYQENRAKQLQSSEDYQRKMALHNETANTIGSVTGQIAGTLGTALLPGVGQGMAALKGAGLAGRLGVMGVEGAIQGLSHAKEESFIKDEKLTASTMLNAMTTGALFGVALGGAFEVGAYGISKAWQAGKSLAQGVGENSSALESVGRAASNLTGTAKEGAELLGSEGNLLARTNLERLRSAGLASDEIAKLSQGIESGSIKTLSKEALQEYAEKQGIKLGEQVLREYVPATTAQEVRNLAVGAQKVTLESAKDVEGAAGYIFGKDSVLDFINQQKTPLVEGVLRKSEGLDALKAMGTVRETTRNLSDNLAKTIQEFSESLVTAAEKKAAEPVLAKIKAIEWELSKASAAAGKTSRDPYQMLSKAYYHLDTSKKALQKLKLSSSIMEQGGRAAGDVTRVDIGKSLANVIESNQEPLRLTLERPDLFGGAGLMQKEVNTAWSGLLKEHAYVTEHLAERAGYSNYETGMQVFKPSSSKIMQFFKGLGAAGEEAQFAHSTVQRSVDSWVGHMKNLVAAEEKFAVMAGIESPTISAANKALSKVEGALSRARIASEARNTLEAMGAIAADSSASQIAGKASMLAPIAGMVGAGSLGGGAAGSVVSFLGGTLTNPAAITRYLSSAEQATNAFKNVATQSAKAAFLKPDSAFVRGVIVKAKNLASSGATVARLGITGAFFTGVKGNNITAATEKRMAEIKAMQKPGAIDDRMSKIFGPTLQSNTPKTTEAFKAAYQNALGFMASKMPADRSYLPQNNNRTMTPQEAEKFGRYWTAAFEPSKCFELLAGGNLQREHIEGLKATHPEVLDSMKSTVLETAKTYPGRVPQERTRQLDMLLGMNGALDPLVAPDLLRTIKSTASEASSQGKPNPNPPNIAKMYSTGLGGKA